MSTTLPSYTSLEHSAALEEYKNIAEQTGGLSDRRQVTNDIYVALNTLFLTSFGYLLTTSHLKTWVPAFVVAAITIVSWFINVTWRRLLEQYRQLIKVRVDYLKAIEQRFPEKSGDVARGMYLEEAKLYDAGHQTGRLFGFTRLEKRLNTVFLVLYPLLAVVITGLTYLVAQGIIPPVTF
jgi:hypothetical protein